MRLNFCSQLFYEILKLFENIYIRIIRINLIYWYNSIQKTISINYYITIIMIIVQYLFYFCFWYIVCSANFAQMIRLFRFVRFTLYYSKFPTLIKTIYEELKGCMHICICSSIRLTHRVHIYWRGRWAYASEIWSFMILYV